MPIAPGTRIGPYEVLAPLGAGGMGEVYRARDSRLGRDVALKIPPAEVAADPGRRQRFELEARAVAALNHPNIVAIYDVAFEDRGAFIASELIQGETLRSVIQRGAVPVKRALDIAAQIADGLAAAHAANIVHRDLKPENVMLTPEGRIKILDFGLAKPIAAATAPADATRTIALTQPGTIVGTVSYMSPEQASGQTEVDGRSDQFSLGLIVHELLTGQKAFARPTAAETMAAIIREDPAPLPPALAGPFRWAIERCLSKDPNQRYHATRDLLLDLRQLLDHAPEITAASASTIAAPTRRRGLALPALAAGLVAGALTVALWLEAPGLPQRYVPLATEPGIQTMPAWSPTGDRIAYAAEVDGLFQVFTRKIGSLVPSQITHQDASCFLPFWSHDGATIFYIANKFGRIDRSLWSTGIAGGQPEKLIADVARAAISPDGKALVLSVRQPDQTYAVMWSSPPGAPPKPFPQAAIAKIRVPFDFQLGFDFTRDGRYLGLLAETDLKVELWKIPLDGDAPQEMLHGHELGKFGKYFNWLPDGNIVWSDSSSGDGHIVRTELASGADRAVTAGVSRERYQALSPDGRNLAFHAGEVGYDLVEIPLDGSPATTVLATDRIEVSPSWAPDGTHFAYITDRSGFNEIWLRDRRDGSERLVVNGRDFPGSKPTDQFFDTAISPDGSRVAYRRMHGAVVEILISPLNGDAPIPLYDDPRKAPQRGPSWSPDGNWIAYYSTFQGRPAVLKVRVGGNHEPEFVGHLTEPNPVRWSPAGQWIAWNDGHRMLMAGPDGKPPRVLINQEWLTYGWSKDGSALFGIEVAGNHRLALARIEIASGRQSVVTDLGPWPASLDLAQFQGDFAYRGFSLHPDGKRFLTSVLNIKGDIWLLEDFDRRLSLFDRILRR